MNYQKIRNRIETGDLFFTASVGVVGIPIRFITQSKVSHVGIFVWIEGRLFVAEATFRGYQLTLASRYKDTKFWYGRSKLANSTEAEIKDGIFKRLGERYGFFGMLASPLIDLPSKQQFCSNSTADILKIDFPALDRGVFPLDIANTCKTLIEVN